jgi:hypothetical protein
MYAENKWNWRERRKSEKESASDGERVKGGGEKGL